MKRLVLSGSRVTPRKKALALMRELSWERRGRVLHAEGTAESKAQRDKALGAVRVTVKRGDWFSVVGSGQGFSTHYLISLKLFVK